MQKKEISDDGMTKITFTIIVGWNRKENVPPLQLDIKEVALNGKCLSLDIRLVGHTGLSV